MPHFCYEARDPDGALVVGRANGPSHMDVVIELRKVGYNVVKVWQKPPLVPGFRFWTFFKRVPLNEVALLTRELGMFFSSGIGLLHGLEAIRDQGFSKQTSDACEHVAKALNEGASLSQAMAYRPDVFRNVYIKLIYAGEVSGTLDGVLSKLSDYLERELLLKRKVQTALAYPILIFLVCVMLTGFLVFFLFPLFVSFFNGLNTQLPAITKSLLKVTEIAKQPAFYITLIVLPFVLSRLYDYLNSRDSTILWMSQLALKLPLIGPMKRAVILSRFCSTLSILISSGIPQFTALSITSDVIDNQAAQTALKAASIRIRDDGDMLSESLAKESLFPRLLVSLVAVGEEVGNLPRVLNLAADTFESDVETTIDRLTVMLEPLILLIMGGIVGYVLLAVFLPIYSMLDAL